MNCFKENFSYYGVRDGYRICEDALVYSTNHWGDGYVYTGLILTSTPFTNLVTQSWKGDTCWPYSLCPASGRFVYHDDDKLNIVDLF